MLQVLFIVSFLKIKNKKIKLKTYQKIIFIFEYLLWTSATLATAPGPVVATSFGLISCSAIVSDVAHRDV